jgi:hypothetical protein
MLITVSVEGYEPKSVDLVPAKKDRFRVETNLTQWHVIDSEVEPSTVEGVGGVDDWSVAMWQRNQFGDEVCKKRADTLCNLLNHLHRESR